MEAVCLDCTARVVTWSTCGGDSTPGSKAVGDPGPTAGRPLCIQ